MLTGDGILMVLQIMLTAGAVVIVVIALRLLERVEIYVPPIGADRIRFARKRGDTFPWECFSKELQDQLRDTSLILLFFSERCSVCIDLVPCLPSFIRGYPDVRFVICARAPFQSPRRWNTTVIINNALYRRLGIGVVPCACRVEHGQIVEFAVVSSAEHLESVLELS